MARRLFGTALAGTSVVQSPKQKLSGADVVVRLRHLGFIVVRAAFGMTLLKRGDRRVMIPDVATIEPGMMEAILRSAAITEGEFFGRNRSGTHARHADDSASSSPGEPWRGNGGSGGNGGNGKKT